MNKIIWVATLMLVSIACKKKPTTLFLPIDAQQSGITFKNHSPDVDERLHALDYLYVYNGAGVASGDFNNDGRADLFFVSNTGSNRLYLNEGDLRFRDVTHAAGVAGFAQWKTGVTVADVNADGWLDIYVCALSNYKNLEGSNELYINMGNNTFQEQAAEYGLDFSGMATQAAFFDYDRDGDVDLYLATHAPNNSRAYDRVTASINTTIPSADKFFRNDEGVFQDVTNLVGINTTDGHSLGLTIADLNNDGWQDVYVTNDFYEGDRCYLNKQDGTFSESATSMFSYHSRFARGCDIADLDNDGFQDVVTVDIRDKGLSNTSFVDDPWELHHHKKSYQYPLQFSRNVLQKNVDGKTFLEVGAFAGVEATGWSWSVLLADFNNDGLKDIFTTAGIPKKLNDVDFLEFAHKDSMRYSETLTSAQVKQILETVPDGKATNHFFQNKGELQFEDKSSAWGLKDFGYANGALYADLDNDGDLEVVVNNLYDYPTLLKNQTQELLPNQHYLAIELQSKGSPIGAKVLVKTPSGHQLQQFNPTRGFLSAISGPLHFGVGYHEVIDSVLIIWNDEKTQVLTNVKANQLISVTRSEEDFADVNQPTPIPLVSELNLSIAYKHEENDYFDFYRESFIPFLSSREGPALVVGDVNGDGLEDFYAGGAKHQAGELYLQQNNGAFQKRIQSSFESDAIFEDVDACLVDVNADGNLDLYVASGGNDFFDKMPQQNDRLYLNDGKGNFKRAIDALPSLLQNKSCVRAADIDGDGDVDFFAGGRVIPFHYGKAAASYILINDGKGRFSNQTNAWNKTFNNLGMITDAQWGDIDGDRDLDLVVVGVWMNVRLFLNENGTLIEHENFIDESSTLKNIAGLWQSVVLTDFDKDGDLDFIAGNLGLNTILRTADTTSLRLLVDIIDKAGKHEPLLAQLGNDGQFYPLHTWIELSKEMPADFLKMYPTAKSFQGTTINKVMQQLNIKPESDLQVNQLASLYFENTGAGKFAVTRLPVAAQYSSIHAMQVADVNNDGYSDVWLGGNTHQVSPIQGSYQASEGVLLMNNREGFFKALPTDRSGIRVKGEIRNIADIKVKNKSAWLFARNNQSLVLYQTTE